MDLSRDAISKVKTLILAGGGFKCMAMLGALSFYQKNLKNVKRIAGTSMGSILGVMWGLGMKPRTIFEEVRSIDTPFVGPSGILKLQETYGLFDIHRSLEPFLKIIRKRVSTLRSRSSGERDTTSRKEALTFEEFFDLTGKDIRVCVSNLSESRVEYWGRGCGFTIEEALIASCSVPLIYTKTKIKGSLYVDGGLFDNLPIKAFFGDSNSRESEMSREEQSKTLAIFFTDPHSRENPDSSLVSYVSKIMTAGMETRLVSIFREYPYVLRLPLRIGNRFFLPQGITSEMRLKLYSYGHEDARNSNVITSGTLTFGSSPT
jgi:hypothetical protein